MKSIINKELDKIKLILLNEESQFTGKFNDENPNEIVWDDIQQSIEYSVQRVNTVEKAKSYLNLLHSKFNKFPTNVKRKIYSIALVSLSGVIISNMGEDNVLCDLNDDLKADIMSVNNLVTNKLKRGCDGSNTSESIRTFSNGLVEFLKYEEGSARHKGKPVLVAYDIGDGMITIGYGHAERKRETDMIPGKTTITLQQADKLLNDDIEEAARYLNRILDKWDKRGIDVPITQGMYDSMVSMIFNMGIGNFRSSKFIQLVKSGELNKAKKIITKTAITYSGHVSRRNKESEMFDIPEYGL